MGLKNNTYVNKAKIFQVAGVAQSVERVALSKNTSRSRVRAPPSAFLFLLFKLKSRINS